MIKKISPLNAVLIGLILLVAATLRFYGSMRRWEGGHIGHNGATYSMIARNHLRYGLIKTRFLSTIKDPLVPDGLRYNVHHPPLLGLMTAASFRILGESEFSARLLPIIFSLGNICLLYLLVVPLWGNAVAVIGTFFAAFMTMDAFYGPHVEVFGSAVLFFILASYLSYREWTRTAQSRYCVTSLLSYVLAMGTEWTGYYVIILVLVEELFREKSLKGAPSMLRIYLVIGGAVFFVYLVAVRVVTGSFLGGTWFESLLFRLNLGARALDYPFTMPQYVRGICYNLVIYFGWPVLALSVLGLVTMYAGDHGEGAGRRARWIVAANLLILGMTHLVIFRNAVYIHDYTLFNLTPGLSLLAAVGLVRAKDYIARYSYFLGYGVLSVLLIAHAAASIGHFYRQHQTLDFVRGYSLGALVCSLTSPRDLVFCAFDYRPEYKYYADRGMVFNATSWDKFERMRTQTGGATIAMYVVDDSSLECVDRKLLEHVATRSRSLRTGDLTIFSIGAVPSEKKNDKTKGGMKQPISGLGARGIAKLP